MFFALPSPQLSNVALRRCIRVKDTLTKFLDDGAPVNCMFVGRMPILARNPQGYPLPRYPIEFAAANAPLDIIQLLVDRGANVANTHALHNAAIAHVVYPDSRTPEETIRVMEFLLSKGCDINRREFQGEDFIAPFTDAHHRPRKFGTPLQYAIYHAYDDRVKFLLENGADPTIPAYNSNTKEYCGTALDWIDDENGEPDACERLRSILIPWMKGRPGRVETPNGR